MEHETRLAYLRGNAFGGLALSLVGKMASLAVAVPPLAFTVASLVLGVFAYASWVFAPLKRHLAWAVPLAVGGAVALAVHIASGMPKAIGIAHFVSGVAMGMFCAFVLERLLGAVGR